MIYSNTYSKPRPLSELMGKEFDLQEMGTGYKRGMILKLYKVKMLEVIGCLPEMAEMASHQVPYMFDGLPAYDSFRLAKMGDPLPLSAEKKRRRRSMLVDIKGAKMMPDDDEKKDYDHPLLMIFFSSGSMWIHEMQMRRYQLLTMLNERLGSKFLKEVRIK